MISAEEAYRISRKLDEESLKREYKENFEMVFEQDLKNINTAITIASKHSMTSVYCVFDEEDRSDDLYKETLNEYLTNLGYEVEFKDIDEGLMVIIAWNGVNM